MSEVIVTPDVKPPQPELSPLPTFLQKWENIMSSLRQQLDTPLGERKPGLFADAWQETDGRFQVLVNDPNKKDLLTPLAESREQVLAWRQAARTAEALNCSREGKTEEAIIILKQLPGFETTTPDELESWYKDQHGNPLQIEFNPNTLTFKGIIDSEGKQLPPLSLRPTELIMALEEIGNTEGAVFLKNHTVISVSADVSPTQELPYLDYQKLLEEKIIAEVGNEAYQQMSLGEKLARRFGLEKKLWAEGKITGFKFICAAETTTTTSEAETKKIISPELVQINAELDEILDKSISQILHEAVRREKPDQEALAKAWSAMLYAGIEMAAEDSAQIRNKAVLALKLGILRTIEPENNFNEFQERLGIKGETEEQRLASERNLIADFINQQVEQAGGQALTVEERDLIINGQFDLTKFSGRSPEAIQNNLNAIMVEALKKGNADVLQSLMAKINKNVLNLINDSLFGRFDAQGIISGVQAKWKETLKGEQLSRAEKIFKGFKSLPQTIKDNPLMILMILLQGQGILLSLLPDEWKQG